jgi:hypothetical protein
MAAAVARCHFLIHLTQLCLGSIETSHGEDKYEANYMFLASSVFNIETILLQWALPVSDSKLKHGEV